MKLHETDGIIENIKTIFCFLEAYKGSSIAGDCRTFIGPSDFQVTNFYKSKPNFTGQDFQTSG